MRLSQAPPTLLSLLFTLLSHSQPANAIPFDFGFLHPRGGGNCGSELQYTCAANEACSTTNNIAFCTTAAAAAGGYAVYTTTYTETDLILRTSTYSSWQGAATTAAWVAPVVASCAPEPVQTSCGSICCANSQSCFTSGSCVDGPSTLWSYASMPAPTVTNVITPVITPSAPVRPTSGGVTVSSTQSITTTQGFVSPATASGSTLPLAQKSSSNGLSPGAIVGIVFGVIAGIGLLLLLCFCCIGVKIFEGILGIFGLGSKKKRRSTERIETVEHYSRHGSGTASRRNEHKTWYGGTARPSRPTERKEKKSSGFGGLGAVGAGLAGLALVLGLKRKRDEKKVVKVERSDIGSSYYTDSYTGTSASSASSRTRDSRRSRPHR